MGEPNPDAVDYYSRIGVSPDADSETIERSRKQADRRFSPMSSSPDGDERLHMRINGASNVLEDGEKRRRYDAFYDAFDRVEGTAVYETISTGVADDVLDDDTLFAHLRGFVGVLGPIDGTRMFEDYYDELDPPITTQKLGVESLPNGYSTSDAGFGIAVWSFHEAAPSCDLSLWLTGGRDLWRSALQDPDDIDGLVASLEDTAPTTAAPTTSVADSATDDTPTTEFTTTQISGHPSSGASPRDDRVDEEEIKERLEDNYGKPMWRRRLKTVFSYVGTTGAWSLRSAGAASATGLLSVPLSVVVFVPMLALALLVRTSLPGVNDAVVGSLGVPIVSPDAPLATAGVVHSLLLGTLIAVPAALTATFVVPWIREHKRRGLPTYDNWVVLVASLGALVAALVGQGTLPRPVGVAVTALVAVFAFQVTLDIGSPPWLSRLCRGVATGAIGLASGLVAVLVALVGLEAIAPSAAAATTSVVTAVPGLSAPIVGLATAEIVVVSFAALATVPLAAATLYSIVSEVGSFVLRLRSRALS